MLAIRIPEDIENRLNALSERTGRTKTFYAREALLRFLEDMEDEYVALSRLKNPGKRLTHEEVRRKVGMED